MADANAVIDILRGEEPVRDWLSNRRDKIGISTLISGIELSTNNGKASTTVC